MKTKIIPLVVFLISYSFLVAQQGIIKIYLQDDSFKSYNLDEIENIQFSKNQNNNIMKIHYQDTLKALYPVISIDSLTFSKDSNNISNLNVYIFGNPRSFIVNEIDSIIFYELKPKLAEGVFIVDSSIAKEILKVDSNYVEFSLQSQLGQNLKVGNVIVSGITDNAPYGFLRKIKTISIENNKIIAQTSLAKLTDAIVNGMFVYKKTFSPDDTLKKFIRSDKEDKPLNLQFSYGIVDIPLAPYITFDINTVFTVDLAISEVIEYNEEKYFMIRMGLEKTQEQIFHAKIEKEFEIKKYLRDLLGSPLLRLPPITIPIPIGEIAIPIVITPNIDLIAGISIKLEAGVSAGNGSISNTISGVEYNNGLWSPIISVEEQYYKIPPQLSIGGTIKGYVGPQLNINFYDRQSFFNTYINVLGFLQLDVDLINRPLWSLYGGIESNVGIESEMFDFDKKFPFIIETKKLIARSKDMIDAINPKSAKMGDTITIVGEGFGDRQGLSLVGFTAGKSLIENEGVIFAKDYVSWSNNEIKVVVPYGIDQGSTKVLVRKDGLYSEMKSLNVEEPEYVQIGNQKWMYKNLNVSTYRNGDPIPEVKDPNEWANLTTGAWCYYNNDPELGKVYGKLYNWYAVNDPRGLAPPGWHIPSYNEWMTLIDFVGYTGSGKLREKGTQHWISDSSFVTNETNFTALGSGWRNSINDYDEEWKPGLFYDLHFIATWWSSTEFDQKSANCVWIIASMQQMAYGEWLKGDGYSIRCIKDE